VGTSFTAQACGESKQPKGSEFVDLQAWEKRKLRFMREDAEGKP